MVFSSEYLVGLRHQFFNGCFGHIVERLSFLLVEQKARCVQILLDLFEAKHFLNGLVVEHHLKVALALKIADLGIVDAFDVG